MTKRSKYWLVWDRNDNFVQAFPILPVARTEAAKIGGEVTFGYKPPLAVTKEPATTVHEDLLALARKIKAEAKRRDQEYIATADPRAVEGGACDWDARELRTIAGKLFTLALDAEGL